jgi:hypothetical protein
MAACFICAKNIRNILWQIFRNTILLTITYKKTLIMTTKKVWMGSTGPFLYDDSVLYIDEDGVIAPDNQCAIATDGQIVVQSAPNSPVHVVRKQDLDDALGDISSLETRVTNLEASVAVAYTRIGAVETRVNSLEARFSTGSFTASLVGYTVTPITYAARYSKSDTLIAVETPFFDGTVVGGTLAITGIPASIMPASSIPIQFPLLAAIPEGYDWLLASIEPANLLIRITARTKRVDLAPGTRVVIYASTVWWKI